MTNPYSIKLPSICHYPQSTKCRNLHLYSIHVLTLLDTVFL
uniref:Uncharacterized protein n=1 Tax=Anguilla anguilla TaxID=7936 RepID=A0A0E9QG37_ANGAN